MYLLTKDTHTFGHKIYYIVGEMSDKYLASETDKGYYADIENWIHIPHEDVEMVDSNKSLLENKLN